MLYHSSIKNLGILKRTGKLQGRAGTVCVPYVAMPLQDTWCRIPFHPSELHIASLPEEPLWQVGRSSEPGPSMEHATQIGSVNKKWTHVAEEASSIHCIETVSNLFFGSLYLEFVALNLWFVLNFKVSQSQNYYISFGFVLEIFIFREGWH